VVRTSFLIAVVLFTVGCGGSQPSRAVSTAQALTGTAEWLEFEPAQVRVELYREVARQSVGQAGRSGAALFPMLMGDTFVAAPGLVGADDLLSSQDAGITVDLRFDTRGEHFAEDRREAFQGLSEREAAEQIARSLLHLWQVKPTGPVTVIRAAGAPYAAAWIDGQLRLNPSFIYLAAAPNR
jgi:hypothetical protein